MLRMGNIKSDGSLDLGDLKYLSSDHHEFPDLFLESGDLLFNRTNSAELVGKTGHYRGIPTPCSFASYLIRLRMHDGLLPSIVLYALNSSLGRKWIKKVVNQTVGQANVNGTKLSGFNFPLPPATEQEVITKVVEEQLSVIEHISDYVEAKLESAKMLRQAILSYALSGKLAPQDSNDEPASKLLKSITEDREERTRQAEAAKRTANSSRTARKQLAKESLEGIDGSIPNR